LTQDKPRVAHVHVGPQVDHEVGAEETVFRHVDLEDGPDDGNRAELESGAAAQMLYGRMLSLPADIAREPPPGPHIPERESDYPFWLRKVMRQIHDEARVARDAASHKYKVTYDLHTALFPGKPGDLVWLYRPTRKRGQNPKLAQKWEGPYMILTRINDLLVRIQHVSTGKKRVTNVQNVAPYVDPDCPVRGAWLTFL